MDKIFKVLWLKECRNKRVECPRFHMKFIHMQKELCGQKFGHCLSMAMRIDWRAGFKGALWHHGNVLFRDWDGSYKGVFVSQLIELEPWISSFYCMQILPKKKLILYWLLPLHPFSALQWMIYILFLPWYFF